MQELLDMCQRVIEFAFINLQQYIDVVFPDLERPQAQQNFPVLRRYFILVTFNVPILTQATNHNILL